MFEQIEWVRCEDRMPEAAGLYDGVRYLVTLEAGWVKVYRYVMDMVRGVLVERWMGEDYRVHVPQPIAWAKMPTGWKDGKDG